MKYERVKSGLKKAIGNLSIRLQNSRKLFNILYSYDGETNSGVKLLLARYNWRQNSKKPAVSPGYVAFQGNNGPADKLRFGVAKMARSGCEIIATYNALLELGHALDIRDLTYYYELHGASLFGLTGTSVYAINEFFQNAGFCTSMVMQDSENAIDYDRLLPFGYVGIFTFWWNGLTFPPIIHTVMLKRLNETHRQIRVYNMHKDRMYYEYPSIACMIKHGGERPLVPISLISINKR